MRQKLENRRVVTKTYSRNSKVPCTTHPNNCQCPLINYLILEATEAAEAVEAEEASEAEANVRMTVGDRLL